MRVIENYDNIKASSGEFERPGNGGYVLEIVAVTDVPYDAAKGKGDYLKIDYDIAVDSHEQVVLLFIILLLLSNYESALIATVEVVEHLHNVAVASVLLIQHNSEVVRDSFIKRFEEAFLVKLGVSRAPQHLRRVLTRMVRRRGFFYIFQLF